ncbi:MAG: cellulase family glycosylhydrolase [Anaerolineae bacterium]
MNKGPASKVSLRRNLLLFSALLVFLACAAVLMTAPLWFLFRGESPSTVEEVATPTFTSVAVNRSAEASTEAQPEGPSRRSPTDPLPSATASPTATLTTTNTPTPIPDVTLAPTPTLTQLPGPPRMDSPEYGMQAFLWWRGETADRDLRLIKEAGFQWVKQSFPWRDIEGAAKLHFDWSRPDRVVEQVEKYGLKLLARVDRQPAWAGGGYPDNGPPDNYQDFADFLYALASRYRGRIHAYQIWNEPNLNVPGRSEWGGRPPNPAEYTALLKVAYQAIKQADPNALVVSAGLSPTTRWDSVAMPDVEFLRQMYANGARPYFDALGVHAAGYKVPPETDPSVVARDPELNNYDPSPEELKRIYCFRHVEDLRQVMVENGDADKQVVVLEFGWTIDPRPESPYHWHAVSDLEQGQYLVRAYQYAKENWTPWIGLMSLIYMPNSDWTWDDEQYWWSVIEPGYPEFKVRRAYMMLKKMEK